jgi:hypothetical protein
MVMQKQIIVLLVGPMLVATIIFSCKKEYSCEGCFNGRQPPIALAGQDQVITLPTDSIELNGTASHDPDGKITLWLWTKISGPASFAILTSSDPVTKAKALVSGSYFFELKVTDNDGLSTKDTVQITVNAATLVNRPPIADAGADTAINPPAGTVNLDGSKSTDPENNITSYAWTKISGPSSFNITNTNAVQTPVTNLVEGNYQFELKVTDAGGLFDKDTMTVVVNAITTSPCDNRPIINAALVPIGTLSDARIELVSATIGSKIFFAGGQSATGYPSRVDIYDITTNTWSTAELSSVNRLGMATATVGNKVFFAGGIELDNGITTSRVDIYDATTNSWSTAELSKARAYLAAATIGNKVFFAGGGSFDPSFVGSNVVDIYDNASNTWTTATLSTGRSSLTANAVGNKIYFAGGASGPGVANNVSTRIDIYDASNNSWSTAELLEPKSNMASIADGNKIYWSGGSKSFATLSDKVEIKDVITGISTIECAIPRSDFYAVKKDDNIVFFTGNTSNFQAFGNQFEIFNTTTRTWSTGVLNHKIRYTSVISVNNTIYVAGGTEDGSNMPAYNKQVWKLEF